MVFFYGKDIPKGDELKEKVGWEMSGKHELAWSEGQEMRSILQNGYLSFLLRIFFERVLAVCSSSQSKQTMKFVVENLGWYGF